jgi:hypothetical protein
MTDVGNELRLSVFILISLITTNNQFAAAFSFQGSNAVYVLNEYEEQRK